MSMINIMPSGNNMTLEPIQMRETSASMLYDETIKSARQFVTNGGDHFQNCFFEMADLVKMKNQTGAIYIMFSHFLCKRNADKKEFSTVAMLAGKKTKFYLKDGYVFLSADFDLKHEELDFSKLKGFTQGGLPGGTKGHSNMIWQKKNTVIFVKYHGKQKKSFQEWVDQFKASVNVVVSSENDKNLTRGIYFSISELEKLDYFNSAKYTHIGLFPIVLKTDFTGSTHFPKYIVTYILVPSNGKTLNYAKNNQLLASMDSWPEIWREHM